MMFKKTVIGLVICGLLFAQSTPVVSNAAGYDLAQTHALLATSTASSSTVGQKNALSKAKSYLKMMAFSYEGLIDQLIFEGYTEEEAKYGADNCGADWNAQALKKAKDYLKMTAFSAKGLQEQLEFEKFTKAEAQYGVENCGADWNEQAKKKAADYLKLMSFSRSGLKDQLVFEGFTAEQAEYGVSQNGF